ncbi:6-carboxytetrahydropterin synthase [bacterium]|nr:6-carboxytetrahydropterin synthase [bacterium]MCB2202322.1 6-carboxytetrahydropterin synthase [bacterium]
MYLTISKRFEFSSSQRYAVSGWSKERNREFYGSRCGTPHGYGSNFTLFTVFHGEVDPRTGMVINVTTIKRRVNDILSARYDHKSLNLDTPPFSEIPPTPENLASALLRDISEAFASEPAQPVACHLMESEATAATAYCSGRVERHFTIDFSAARRTLSPHLTDQENNRLFGEATNIHGHGYRLRATIDGDVDLAYGMIVPPVESERMLTALHAMLDHQYLNELPEMSGRPMTTEMLVRFVFVQLAKSLPLNRVKLWENPRFFAEHCRDGHTTLSIENAFNAAHRLHSPHLSDEENLEVFGKCNNPNGHGHLYRLETSIGGEVDERNGTLFDLAKAYAAAESVIKPWAFAHLDQDTSDFVDRASTAENMMLVLWPRLQQAFEDRAVRSRLWETPNNRFTVRREVDNLSSEGSTTP